MATVRKPRRLLRTLAIIGLVLGGILFGLYHLVQSPRFIRWMISRLNQSLSGEITYQTLNLDLNRGHLDLKGMAYQSEKGEPIFQLDSLDLDFDPAQALRAKFQVQRLRAQGLRFDQRNLQAKTVSTWRTTLRLVLKRVALSDSLFEGIDVTLRNGDHFEFEQATVSLSAQERSRQQLDLWVNKGEFHFGKLDLHSSTLSVKGEVEFPVFREHTFLVSASQGTLRLEEVEIENFPATSFESEFHIDGENVFLEKGRLRHPQGELELSGKYNPGQNRYAIELKNVAPFPFTIIPKIHKEVLETFGTFDLTLKAEAEGKKLAEMDGKLDLHIKVHGNTANPESPEQQLWIKGPLKDGVLHLEDFRLTSAKSTVKATGKVDFAHQKFDTKVDVKDFDIETLVESLSDIDLMGYASAQGTIQGDFKSPEFDIKANATVSGYSFLRFSNIVGDFKIHQGVLSFDGNITTAGQTAKVNVKTENIYHKGKHTTLKTEFNNLDVSALVANDDLTGRVTGIFEMEDYSETPPQGTLKATISDFILLNFHIGELQAEGRLENRKFILAPVSFQPPDYEKVTLPKETVFSFDDSGVKVAGELFSGVSFTGDFKKSNPNRFNLEAILQNFDIRSLLATWQFKPVEAYTSGKVKIGIGLNKTPSEVDIQLSEFRIPLEETEIRSAELIDISIRGPRISFNRARFHAGGETFGLTGSWNLGAGLDLNLSGKWNLELVKLFPKVFHEGQGFANVDLKLRGTLEKPSLSGEVTFSEAMVNLRGVRGEIENLKGKILLKENQLHFENLQGTMADGDVNVNGHIELKEFKPSYYDLKIEAREATVSEPGTYKLVFSGDVALKGPAEDPLLSGKIFLTEGRYSRDFSITQFIIKPKPKALPTEINPLLSHLRLDLEIKSSGELAIKNNVAKMYLQTNLKLKGPASKPDVLGTLEIVEGEFKYFTIEFENAKGLIDFRDPKKGPYVDILATKEFTQRYNTVNITAHIFGFSDNLQLNFSSDVGMDKRDILALVFTGNLPGEGSGFSSTQLASSVVASQVGALLQGTLAEKAQLDVFRLEASDPERKNLTTLVIGKQLTPRLSLEFKTDLGVDDPLQGIQMEYLILDNLLMEASQLSDGSFGMNMTLRWRSF